jgi:hypothetical protein
MSQPSQGPGNQGEDAKVAFHNRAGASHMEARKLLTAMAVGSIGVLYATLTGKDAPALTDFGKTLAILIIIAMGLSTMFGFAAWRADARWAYAKAKEYDKAIPDEPPNSRWSRWKSNCFAVIRKLLKASASNAENWHTCKKVCDLMQLAFFTLGIAAAMFLTIAIILLK